MQPTLLILAAGMASRYGSMKQTEGFGPSGETIMDYSIYDAIRAGFGKIVFIIRKDFAEEFKAGFDAKLAGKVKVEYVYQEPDVFVDDEALISKRQKPWGTGHAVLCARDVVKEPFAVINADDFYGADAFEKAYQFLTTECDEKTWAIIGYRLSKTLSKHGTVSRGVCRVGGENNLSEITERTKIYAEGDKIFYEEAGEKSEVDAASSVSMNFWCLHPSAFELTEKLFKEFVEDTKDSPKAEFFIPLIGDYFIRENLGTIKVIPTGGQWFGVTYREDAPAVKESIDNLVITGIYAESLW